MTERTRSDVSVNEKPETERLSAKVFEVTYGWACAVYTGDGTIPGSLKGGAGAFSSADDAWAYARDVLERRGATERTPE